VPTQDITIFAKDEKLKFQYCRTPPHSRPAGEFPKEHHSSAEPTLPFYKKVAIFC